MTTPPDDSWLTTDDGTRLWVETDGPAGAALTLVFIHGYTLSTASFAEQRAALADSPLGRVFYDQRAFGRSDRGNHRPATMRGLAADLDDVLRSVDGPVVLIGHSMGGMVIQSLAGLRPELFGAKVRGTVLIATTACGDDIGLLGLEALVRRFGAGLLRTLHRARPVARLLGTAPFGLAALVFHDRRASRAARRAFVEMSSANELDVLADYLQAMLAYDEVAALPALGAVPCTVIAPTSDPVTSVAANRRVAETVPGAELVVVPAAGHMVTLEQPEAVNSAIAATVDRVLEDLGRTKLPG